MGLGVNDSSTKLNWWGRISIGLVCAAIVWATWALAAGSPTVILFLIFLAIVYIIFEWKWSPDRKRHHT